MSAPASQTQWYLARDGQQFGPLSELELAKFIELGHLQPTDLLWREGFPDWRPALVVFPPRKPAAAAADAARARHAAGRGARCVAWPRAAPAALRGATQPAPMAAELDDEDYHERRAAAV